MCCSSISSNSNSHPYGWALGRANRTTDGKGTDSTDAAQRLLGIQRSTDTDLSLTVQTKEGDTVTISFDHEVDAAMLRYGTKGGDGPSGVMARSRSTTDSLQIQVAGSLSDDELADVQALIQRVIGSLTGGNAATIGTTPATPAGTTGGTASGDSTAASGADTSAPPATTSDPAATTNADPTDTLAGFTLSITRSRTFDVVKIAPAAQPLAPTGGTEASGAPVVAAGPTTTDSTPATSGAPTAAVAPTTAPAWLLDLLRAASGTTMGAMIGTPGPAPISLTPITPAA